MDLAPITPDEARVSHFFQLPHHGAAVQAQVLRQCGIRNRYRYRMIGTRLPQLAEIRQELEPYGGLSENVDPVGLVLRLACGELEQVADQLAVMGTRLGAPLDNVFIVDEQHVARLARAHVVLLHVARQQEDLAENAVAKQFLHHALVPVRIAVIQAGVAAHEHPQFLRPACIGGDDLPCVKGRLA